MKTIFLIAENNHFACHADRNVLLNRVLRTHETILGYEGQMYLLTPSKSIARGIHGIDDIIFQLFANFMRLHNNVRLSELDKADISIKRINVLLSSFNTYKNSSVSNYVEIINKSVEKINNAWHACDPDKLLDVVKDELITYSKLAYEHPDFSELLIKPNVRALADLSFNKESMQKIFVELPLGEWDNVTKQQYISIWQEIIERLRSIVMAENIRKIVLCCNDEVYGTFIVGKAHAPFIKKYIEKGGVHVIRCNSYADYYNAIPKPEHSHSPDLQASSLSSTSGASTQDIGVPVGTAQLVSPSTVPSAAPTPAPTPSTYAPAITQAADEVHNSSSEEDSLDKYLLANDSSKPSYPSPAALLPQPRPSLSESQSGRSTPEPSMY